MNTRGEEIRSMRKEMRVKVYELANELNITINCLYLIEHNRRKVKDEFFDYVLKKYTNWSEIKKEEPKRIKINFPTLTEQQKKDIEHLFFSENDNRYTVIAEKVKASKYTTSKYIDYILDNKFDDLNNRRRA